MLRPRRAFSQPQVLRLYSRPGCCLCDQVQEALAPWLQSGKLSLKVVNIEDDPELESRFGQVIPVLEDPEGRVLAKGKFRVEEAMARWQRRRKAR
ncbi:MAG: glutaredoxin family protein [Planctomycetota bacterium]|nr:MAG: glutaredoxin family protein [Planctomycetota bacterium]